MCDVTNIFNLLKQIEKQKTLKDIPFDYLSFVIDAIFSELKGMDKLHINTNKLRILKYFPTRFPYMLDNKCTCDIIIQGIVDVGILDAKHKFWPDFYAIKKTKRRSITRSEMKMIERRFYQQSKIMLETGHITEKVYDALGFPKYQVSGVVYDCNDVVYRKQMQKSKVLTHWSQKHLRLAQQKKIEDKMEKRNKIIRWQ